MRMRPGTAKAAELASGIGAIVLGAGLALMAPSLLKAYALPVLITGVVVHGAGMTLKHRLERSQDAAWWERALFWGCWAALGALAVWIGVVLSRG